MNVRALRPEESDLVAGWLQDERNSKWLDFGGGRRSVDAVGLRLMCQRDLHCLRVYSPAGQDRPVGIVGLSNVDRQSRTAEAWCVLGDKHVGHKDLTIRAMARLLKHGFGELALESVFAWTVEVNRGGRRLLDRLPFRFIGRRRRCHEIDGKLYDRLLFDLVAEEFRGFTEDRFERRSPGRRPAAAARAGRATARSKGSVA